MTETETAVETGDAELIRRSLEQPEVFAVLLDRYAAQLHRYVVRRLGPDQAEDVVSETFLAAFQHRRRYDLRHPGARPWLYGIASNLIGKRRRAELAEMTEIGRLWDDGPEGTRADLAPSRARLLAEIDGRRRPRVPVLRVAPVVAAAVAAVAAALVAVVPIGARLTDTGPPRDAADLLERAALAAAEQPDLTPGPGQYVHTEMRTVRMTTRPGPGSQARQLSIPYREERWEPAGAGRPWLLRERSLDPMWDQGVNDTVHTTSCDWREPSLWRGWPTGPPTPPRCGLSWSARRPRRPPSRRVSACGTRPPG
ncbi:RNA polymerase sigma factor [Herbidospora cretacea]|uniref:RNA polymerase sigma factor n=1 Tax=Herbidospora cretacea TaxID=28444 RepID=UPI000B1A0983|nr:sigma-70 family RNA polymerase sigma factor [Herbidospora cretacea]